MAPRHQPETASAFIELVPVRPTRVQAADRPQQPKRAWLARHALLLVTFVLPSVLSAVYFGLIASDRYTTEAQFVVRSQSRATVDQLTSLVQTTGRGRADDEASALHEFIKSRDAMILLLKDADLRGILSRPEADLLWRFPNFSLATFRRRCLSII